MKLKLKIVDFFNDVDCAKHCFGYGFVKAFVFVFYEELKSVICKYKGHIWNYENYTGPDNGYDYLECKRCGKSQKINYY